MAEERDDGDGRAAATHTTMWTFAWGPLWVGLAVTPVPEFSGEVGETVHALLVAQGWRLATVVPDFALYRRTADVS
jgi:hypothetical protein